MNLNRTIVKPAVNVSRRALGHLKTKNNSATTNVTAATTIRWYSVHGKPPATSDPTHPSTTVSRLTVSDLYKKYQQHEPISMLTAVDYHSGMTVDQAGVDMILVGDSLGMTALGYDSTVPVTMNNMIHHCRAVHRGSTRSFLVGDMPFGSYEFNEDAVRNAIRFVKEGNMQAVKLEGTDKVPQIRGIVSAGIPVIGHIGLTPQAINQLGSYKVVGKTPKEAVKLWESAQEIQESGASMLVLECVPQRIAQQITESLHIPTIGIGSGPCSGQVLVFHDLLGMYHHFTPKFCKQYLSLNEAMKTACKRYSNDVKARVFPEVGKHTFIIAEQAYKAFLGEISERTRSGVQAQDSPSNIESPRTDHQHHQKQHKSKSTHLHLNRDPIQEIVVLGSGATGAMMSTALSGMGKSVTMVPARGDVTPPTNKSTVDTACIDIAISSPGDHQRSVRVRTVNSFDQVAKDIDLLIVTVKNYDTTNVLTKFMQQSRVNIKRVLSVQNGWGNCSSIEQVTKNCGVNPEVYQASLYTGCKKIGNSAISVTHDKIDLRLPELLKQSPIGDLFSGTESHQSAAQQLFTVGFTAYGDQVDWKKMVVNSVINPITAVFNVVNGSIASNEHLRTIATQLTEECMTVIRLLPDAREQFEAHELKTETMINLVMDTALKTQDNISSMLSDIRSKRGNTEIDSLNAVFVQRASELGVELPVNQVMIQMVRYKSSDTSSPTPVTAPGVINNL